MSIRDHLLRAISGTHPSGKLRSESPPPGFDFLSIGRLADPAFSSTRAASWFVCAALCLCACAAQRAQEEETSAPDANTPDAVEHRPVGEAFATELSLRDCTGSSHICSIERLSLPSTPVAKDEPGLALSADGSVLVVSTQEGVLLVDRKSSTCAPILARDGTPLGGTGLSISADGSVVAFVSPGPWLPSVGSGDLLYVYERAKDDLVAVNVDADGQSKVSEGHASSRESEGFAALERSVPESERMQLSSRGLTWWTSLSADGRLLAYSMTPAGWDRPPDEPDIFLFLYDRDTGESKPIDLHADEPIWAAYPVLSADAGLLAFLGGTKARPVLWGVLDRQTQRLELGEHDVDGPVHLLSGSGTRIAFGVPDLKRSAVVFDRNTGEEYSIGSTSLDRFYSLSDDGALFAFASLSAMLPADSNTFNDIYLFEPDGGRFELVSAGANGEASDSDSFQARLSADGRVLAFVSKAKNLVSTDTRDGPALFVAQLAGQ